MIKVVETLGGENKPPNHLFVSVAVDEPESAGAEFSRVKAALLEWQKSGRAAKGSLAIEIQTETPHSNPILHAFMITLSGQDPLVHEFYTNLRRAEISMVSPSGKTIKNLGFAR